MIKWVRRRVPAPTTHTARIAAFPDYCQQDTDYGGFPSGNYCGPTAASNTLFWLSDRGYPTICPATADRKEDQHDLIVALGSATYMNTDSSFSGTGPQQMCSGLKGYILACEYTYRRLLWEGWDPSAGIAAEFDTGIEVPTLGWIKDAVARTGGALILAAYGQRDGEGLCTITGGHWFTIVGYGWTGSEANAAYLSVHDPWNTGTTTEHLSSTVLSSGSFYVDVAGLPHYTHTAVGYLELAGVPWGGTQEFWVIGAVVLEMS